jgi:tRNA-2-methylthio-N6-dimethylallyladenosine synthase
MNVHDSEKVSNLLYHAGLCAAQDEEQADVLLINTCSIRDKAENQLYTDLGKLDGWKRARRGRVIGVGGCVAQQVGDSIMRRFPHLDFVFGTHNVRLVPAMAESALAGERAVRTDETRSLERFDLPELHPALDAGRGRRAFVTVMEGCDMFCSFCIVPTTRGREVSRPAEGILDEARRLAERGVCEITLLGQTVNAYGRHDVRRDSTESAGTMAFAELLGRLDAIPGLDRIRYTSPHPLFFDEALCQAHGELDSLCPHVHLPLQSGSDRVLEAMRRRYGRDEFLAIVERLRASRPDIAITTDLIVGFPGETEADFEDTLDLVRRVGFVDSYSFKYSARPGTGAAELPAAVPAEEAQRRLVALQTLQRDLTIAHHRSRIGSVTRILLEGASRRGAGQLCGRDPHRRLVNLAPDAAGLPVEAEAGALLEVEIVEATPHSLIGTVRAEDRPSDGNPERIPGSAVKLRAGSADAEERDASAIGSEALRVIG